MDDVFKILAQEMNLLAGAFSTEIKHEREQRP